MATALVLDSMRLLDGHWTAEAAAVLRLKQIFDSNKPGKIFSMPRELLCYAQLRNIEE